jgi:hypothetical protein
MGYWGFEANTAVGRIRFFESRMGSPIRTDVYMVPNQVLWPLSYPHKTTKALWMHIHKAFVFSNVQFQIHQHLIDGSMIFCGGCGIWMFAFMYL